MGSFPLVLWFFLGFSLAYPVAGAEMVLVSPAGIDASACDGVSQPWKSISYALARIPETGGVTIQVEPGEYPSLTCTKIFQRPVRIQARKKHESILVPNEAHGPIFFNHVENVQINGFIIDNRNNRSISNAVHLLGGCSNISILNNIITHGSAGYPYADAVKIHQNVHHILMEGNLIFDGKEEEVEIADDCSDVVFRRNVVLRISSPSSAPLIAVKRRCRRIALDSNIFSNRNRENQQGIINIGSAIQTGEETADVLLMNNVFAHAGGSCTLGLTGCLRVLISKNLIYNFGPAEGGIDCYRCYPTVQPPIQIESIFIMNNIFIQTAGIRSFTWFRCDEEVPFPSHNQNCWVEFADSTSETENEESSTFIYTDQEDSVTLPAKLNQWLQEYLHDKSNSSPYE